MNQNAHTTTRAPSEGGPSLTFRDIFKRERWALVPRQSLFLLTALPLALTMPIVVICLVSVGTGLMVLGVGVGLLLAAAAVSRWFGALELRRLVWAGASPIEPPEWPVLSDLPWTKRIQLALLDRRQWSYIAYAGLYLVLGTVTGSLALVWLSAIVNGATRWLWNGWATTTPPGAGGDGNQPAGPLVAAALPPGAVDDPRLRHSRCRDPRDAALVYQQHGRPA